MSITLPQQFVIVECCHDNCGLTFALTEDYRRRRRNDHKRWFCPEGHGQSYTGQSDEQKLKAAEAREVALQDQLRAAIREGDAARAEVLRIRQRIANGVCPCCTRSFPNVMAHMATKHPDFALPENVKHATEGLRFKCSCWREFETYQGLRIHQGTQRSDGWDSPDASRWSAHLTVV